MCMCVCVSVHGQVPHMAMAFRSWLLEKKEEDSKLDVSQFGLQGTPPGIGGLWLCDLIIVQGLVAVKRPEHGSRLSCHHPKILNDFGMRAPTFVFRLQTPSPVPSSTGSRDAYHLSEEEKAERFLRGPCHVSSHLICVMCREAGQHFRSAPST